MGGSGFSLSDFNRSLQEMSNGLMAALRDSNVLEVIGVTVESETVNLANIDHLLSREQGVEWQGSDVRRQLERLIPSDLDAAKTGLKELLRCLTEQDAIGTWMPPSTEVEKFKEKNTRLMELTLSARRFVARLPLTMQLRAIQRFEGSKNMTTQDLLQWCLSTDDGSILSDAFDNANIELLSELISCLKKLIPAKCESWVTKLLVNKALYCEHATTEQCPIMSKVAELFQAAQITGEEVFAYLEHSCLISHPRGWQETSLLRQRELLREMMKAPGPYAFSSEQLLAVVTPEKGLFLDNLQPLSPKKNFLEKMWANLCRLVFGEKRQAKSDLKNLFNWNPTDAEGIKAKEKNLKAYFELMQFVSGFLTDSRQSDRLYDYLHRSQKGGGIRNTAEYKKFRRGHVELHREFKGLKNYAKTGHGEVRQVSGFSIKNAN